MKAKAGVYLPVGTDGYELCHPIGVTDFERINVEVNGVSRGPRWIAPPMRLVHEDEGKRLSESDSPWLGSHALIFRARAARALDNILQRYGELLPVECNEADMSIYNVTRVIDALDEQASSLVRIPSGRLMTIQRYAFRAEVVRDVDIFKIPNLRVSPTYVSHRFVEFWRSSGLTGLEFKRLWEWPN